MATLATLARRYDLISKMLSSSGLRPIMKHNLDSIAKLTIFKSGGNIHDVIEAWENYGYDVKVIKGAQFAPRDIG
jgi:hypothetical protein